MLFYIQPAPKPGCLSLIIYMYIYTTTCVNTWERERYKQKIPPEEFVLPILVPSKNGLKVSHSKSDKVNTFAPHGDTESSATQAGCDTTSHKWMGKPPPMMSNNVLRTSKGLLVRRSSVQFKMVSMCSEKPICAPPCLSEVSSTSPLKLFQCSSDWRRPSLKGKTQEKGGMGSKAIERETQFSNSAVSTLSCWPLAQQVRSCLLSSVIVVVVDCFYIMLFSALEQTHCTRVRLYLSY